MHEFEIESIDDARLDPYRDLKHQAGRRSKSFIAEGEKLVLRLLESDCRTESIVCVPAARDRIREHLRADVPVYVTSTPVISQLIGFQFHRGILACGQRPAEQDVGVLCRTALLRGQSLIVVCPELRDPTNLGTIIRTAAAFGASGLIAGRAGTDPFSRRVLRTSMGSVLQLPIVQTDDWGNVLTTLEAVGFETIALVLDPAAEVLSAVQRPERCAIFLGNEAEGLPDEIVARCKRRVTMPMAASVDSLNVAVAAGIVLHQFVEGLRVER